MKEKEGCLDFDHTTMPDPVNDAFRRLTICLLDLEKVKIEARLNHEIVQHNDEA